MIAVDLYSGIFAAGVTIAAVLAVVAQIRAPSPSPWRWWGPPAFALGWLAAMAAALSRLDELGESGSLTAHIVQHVGLGDIAAPLLLIGLPPAAGAALGASYGRATGADGRRARVLRVALSPLGAAALWMTATFFWLVPSVHRLAIPDGPVHLLDHVSFLAFGLLLWLAVFDVREGGRVTDWDSFMRSLRTCDLPWWGRHGYAMATRVALIPAIAVIWIMPSDAYFLSGQTPPGGLTRHEDQVQAASMMLGFEILLFVASLILGFIFAAIAEGRERERARPAGRS